MMCSGRNIERLEKRDPTGGQIAIIGGATEEVHLLNGVRVRVTLSAFPEHSGKTGTIYLVEINRKDRNVQIWVDMGEEFTWCMRPKNVEIVDDVGWDKFRLLAEYIEIDNSDEGANEGNG